MSRRTSVSLVVVAYNMDRELPRTLRTLVPPWQRQLDDIDYEVVVVDNGSAQPIAPPADPSVRLIRIDDAPPSPAKAVNVGLSAARGDLIGVLVDGARMASPGLVHHAVLAAQLHRRPVVTTLGRHLGPDVQMRSIHSGYDQAAEDKLLDASDWQADGYQLFAISSWAGSSAGGWFAPIAESNALFLTREMWSELGGYDERFVSPGGGLVNLDAYARACELPGSQVVVLLGETTFHQVHGGVATNALESPWERFHEEYVAIRGKRFSRPDPDRIYLGRIAPVVAPTVRSAQPSSKD